MKRLYTFDFDGTLTTADTLLVFIRYACGTWRFIVGFLLHSPLLVLMKLKLYPQLSRQAAHLRLVLPRHGAENVSTRCADSSPSATPA